jgi:hypothetical protein
MAKSGSKQNKQEFLGIVFPAELEEIEQRRKNAGLEKDPLSGNPSTDKHLVGLALSGGGIRSATFSLGIIQGLARHGLLKHVDLLSTVSGGGYTGSCLSALLNDPKHGTNPENFPLRYSAGSREPVGLTHLRNCSNYLSPAGLLPKLRLPNLMLRGILLNLFIFLPYIMLAVFLTEIAYEVGPHWNSLPHLILPLVLIFLVMAVMFPFVIRVAKGVFNWRRRNAFELWLTVPLLLALIVVMAIPFLNITRLAIEHSTGQFLYWYQHLAPADIWRGAGIALGIIFAMMLAGKASQNINRIGGKIMLWALGLLGPAIIFAIYLALCLWQIDSPFMPAVPATGLNAAVDCEQPCLQFIDPKTGEPGAMSDSDEHLSRLLFHRENGPRTVNELVNAMHGRTLTFGAEAEIRCQSGGCTTEYSGEDWLSDDRVWVINNSPAKIGTCPDHQEWVEWDLQTWRKWSNSPQGGQCTYITRASADSFRIEGRKLHLLEGTEDYLFFALFAALLLINRLLLDINITSMHGFYRDRLSKAFLFKVDEHGDVHPDDRLTLSKLNGEGTVAPYHLINVTMNLQGSNAPDLRGRESSFFIFSHRYSGSERTGYFETTEMEKFDRHLGLDSAMAISGAAAAPNMGSTTNRSLVFIMTLLNIRLGYWLPNPVAVKKPMWFKRIRLSSAQPSLIWKEALAQLDADGTHVNLSDGGHLENLAIYGLLKRRCKFIVAVDGEADPDMTFHGLVTLMRYARIDMGIEIMIDLDDLRIHHDGYSRNHWALGEIRYGDGETGQLLYVKLSVTGDEPEYIRSYRAHHREFPHESTADQFFSEAQFEAYRALGEHACEGMLKDVDAIGGFATLEAKPRSSDTA